MAFAKHIKTGQTVQVPAHYIGHPVLGKNLVALNDEIPAAPKKEKKKAVEAEVSAPESIEEQPAPEINIQENKE